MPAVVRAVARANGQNRLAIIVPCHRVIGKDGGLTGYGGGLERKEWLLNHEAQHIGNNPFIRRTNEIRGMGLGFLIDRAR